MSGKGVIGGIIASVVLSVSIVGALGYFLLPVIFPSVGEDQGIVLQSIYLEANTIETLSDTETTYEKVPGTELNITINENSKILAQFSSSATLTLGSTFTGGVNFFIALVVEGVGNRTVRIHFFENSGGVGYTRESPGFINTFYQTGTLASGTYIVSVYWKCESDATGSNSIGFFNYGGNKPRALLVQEIK
jgi:hypothetical protein